MILILLGAPGVGKGTQGSRLAERLGVAKVATGDILRAAVRDGSELGKQARSYMEAGELVPDGLILDLIGEVLASPEAADGAILDGFPRTVPQAEGLDALLREHDRALDGVVVIEVADEVIVRRMSGRRVCDACGAVFNVHSDPPSEDGVCDQCGGTLRQRSDDAEGTVRHRLTVYRENTAPLIEFYEARPVPVHTVDGDQPIEAVEGDILSSLGR